MTEYRVRWEIDVDGDDIVDAAHQAREAQTREGTIADVFTVRPKDDPFEARWDLVDLGDIADSEVRWEYGHKALYAMAEKMVADGGDLASVLELLEKPWHWPELLAAASLDSAFDAVSPGEDVPDTSDDPVDDLPPGYRWATEREMERPDAIVVPRTVDSEGRPYTDGEGDVAVLIDATDVTCRYCDALIDLDIEGPMSTGYWMNGDGDVHCPIPNPSGFHQPKAVK